MGKLLTGDSDWILSDVPLHGNYISSRAMAKEDFHVNSRLSSADAKNMIGNAFKSLTTLEIDIPYFEDNYLSFALGCKAVGFETEDKESFFKWLRLHPWSSGLEELIRIDMAIHLLSEF